MASTSESATSNLPYNTGNYLLTKEDITHVLQSHCPGAVPRDVGLYRKAFVHRSYCTRKNENFLNGNTMCPPGCLMLQEESNERLEFLGDAVINLVVAQYLYVRYPDENEGFLTRLRTKIVNGNMLASFAASISFSKFLVIARQIEEGEGRTSKKLLEDCFEAFMGAMLLDLGFEVCQRWFVAFLESHLDFASLVATNNNHKDTLVKHFLHSYNETVRFFEMQARVVNNSKVFTVCIKDKHGSVLGIGQGGSRKEAENEAARVALEKIRTPASTM